MKSYKLIPSFFVVLSIVLSFTSCLKDTPNNISNPAGTNNVIEFYNIGSISNSLSDLYPVYTKAYDPDPTDTFDVIISYSGADMAPRDINVNIAVDTTALSKYNNSDPEPSTGQFDLLDTSLYTLSATSVTIPKGQQQARIQVIVKPSQFDFSKNYALPLTITQSSYGIISGNFQTILVNIVVKNQYDGVYDVDGQCIDANGLYKGDYPRSISLITVNANTVVFYDNDYEYSDYIVINNAGTSAASTTLRPTYVIDPETNAVTKIYDYNTGTPFTVGSISKYNPDDGSLDIDWTSGRWHVTEHYTYTGSR